MALGPVRVCLVVVSCLFSPPPRWPMGWHDSGGLPSPTKLCVEEGSLCFFLSFLIIAVDMWAFELDVLVLLNDWIDAGSP